MKTNSALYVGEVFHRRLRPRVHQLRYRVFSLLLDLDELHSLRQSMWLFSYNRWNLFSFYDRDFGEQTDESLPDYVRRKLIKAGITDEPDRIQLSCYPRVCGHAFNPLSLFYCFDRNGQLFAVLHEVHNTFGERHAYVLPVIESERQSNTEWLHQRADKALFVSPFAHMDMQYRFRLNNPAERQVIVIRVHDTEGHLLSASYTAKRRSLNSSALLKLFFTVPLLSVKVVGGIHWQALKLWLKRVPWFSHVPKHIR